MGKVAWALDSAHKNGVVHRDVKPENILITLSGGGDDHPWLADFGIAKDAAAGTLTSGQMPFSPAYAAPEQIHGRRKIGGRADQYALACTLYDALVGEPPFGDIKRPQSPPPISSVIDVPTALDTVFARALAKEPDRRYESCRAFVAAARQALDLTGAGTAPEQHDIMSLPGGLRPAQAGATEYDRPRTVDPQAATEYDPGPAQPPSAAAPTASPTKRQSSSWGLEDLIAIGGVIGVIGVIVFAVFEWPGPMIYDTVFGPPATLNPPRTVHAPPALPVRPRYPTEAESRLTFTEAQTKAVRNASVANMPAQGTVAACSRAKDHAGKLMWVWRCTLTHPSAPGCTAVVLVNRPGPGVAVVQHAAAACGS